MPSPVLHDEVAKRLLHLESVIHVILGRLESIERGGCHAYLQRRPEEAQDLPNVELPIEVSFADSVDVKNPQPATAFQQAPEPQADALPVSLDEQSLENDDPLQLESFGDGAQNETEAPTQRLGRFSQLIQKMVSVKHQHLDGDTQEIYEFTGSTWDIALFIGTDILGSAGSFQTCLIVVSSLIMQVVFLGVAWSNFMEPSISQSTVAQMKAWRVSIGHSRHYFDQSKEVSLTSRVCGLDKSLHNSGVQAQLYENVLSYLQDGSIFNGRILCVVALACWFLMVSKELHHSLDLYRALTFLPIRAKTEVRVLEGDDEMSLRGQKNKYNLVSITLARALVNLFILMYRLGLAAALMYIGTMFLVNTVDVNEIVLNAVALELILNIDDLVFDALATAPSKHLIRSLAPLRVRQVRRCHGADAKSVFMTIAIPTTMFCVWYFLLLPLSEDLEGVKYATCGGNTDFVVGTHLASGLVLAYGCEEFDTESTEFTPEGLEQLAAAKMAWNGGGRQYIPLSSWRDMSLSLGQSLEEYGETIGRCYDLNMSTWTDYDAYLGALRTATETQSLQSCRDVTLGLCSNSSAARLFCPVTCGCNDVYFGTYALSGCPMKVCAATDGYKTMLQAMISSDIHPEVLSDLNQWKQYWNSYVTTMDMNPRLNTIDVDPRYVRDMFLKMGCDGLAHVATITKEYAATLNFFCAEGSPLNYRPLRPFCSKTCSCETSDPKNDVFCPVTPAAAGTCTDLRISGVNISSNSSSCGQDVPPKSNPNGFYGCYRAGNEGSDYYVRIDDAGVKWDLRLEREMAWGGRFLGQRIGLKGIPKWTLGSEVENQRQSRFFAVARSSNPADALEWFPRTSNNTDIDCAEGVPALATVRGLWYIAAAHASCDATCSVFSRQCHRIALHAHNPEVGGDVQLFQVISNTPASRVISGDLDPAFTLPPTHGAYNISTDGQNEMRSTKTCTPGWAILHTPYIELDLDEVASKKPARCKWVDSTYAMDRENFNCARTPWGRRRVHFRLCYCNEK